MAAKKEHYVRMWAESMVPELTREQADALVLAKKWQAQSGFATSEHATHKKLWIELHELGLLDAFATGSYRLNEAGTYVLERMKELGWI